MVGNDAISATCTCQQRPTLFDFGLQRWPKGVLCRSTGVLGAHVFLSRYIVGSRLERWLHKAISGPPKGSS